MKQRCLLLCAGVLAAPVVAQKTDISIRPATQPLQYTIESSSKLETQSRMTIDGEEADRGGRGPGGPVATTAKVVFDEGPQGAMWRVYSVAEASETRPGRDGEGRTTTVTGALIGKRIHIDEGADGVVVREGDAKGEALPRQLVQDLPVSMALSGLTPSEPVEVGEEFDLGPDFAKALRAFVHPIRPAPQEQADEGDAGDEGQRGRRGGRGRGPRAVRDAALSLLTSAKLDCKATGKLVDVADGIAKISIDATFEGEGSPADLGMGGFGGGRGARGAGTGGGPGGGSAQATLHATGTMLVDVARHQLQQLQLKGDVKSSSEMKRETERGEFESKSSSEGSFDLAVSCKPSPAKDGSGN